LSKKILTEKIKKIKGVRGIKGIKKAIKNPSAGCGGV